MHIWLLHLAKEIMYNESVQSETSTAELYQNWREHCVCVSVCVSRFKHHMDVLVVV